MASRLRTSGPLGAARGAARWRRGRIRPGASAAAADHRDSLGQDGEQERADDPDDERPPRCSGSGLRLGDRCLRQYDRRCLDGVLRRHLEAACRAFSCSRRTGRGWWSPCSTFARSVPVTARVSSGLRPPARNRPCSGRSRARECRFLGRVARLERPDQHVRGDDQRNRPRSRWGCRRSAPVGDRRGVEERTNSATAYGHGLRPVYRYAAGEKTEQGERHHHVPTPAHDRPDFAEAHDSPGRPVSRDSTSATGGGRPWPRGSKLDGRKVPCRLVTSPKHCSAAGTSCCSRCLLTAAEGLPGASARPSYLSSAVVVLKPPVTGSQPNQLANLQPPLATVSYGVVQQLASPAGTRSWSAPGCPRHVPADPAQQRHQRDARPI